jgi:hypothetical protein
VRVAVRIALEVGNATGMPQWVSTSEFQRRVGR